MNNRKIWSFALSVLMGSLISTAVLSFSTTRASARPVAVNAIENRDNVALYQMFEDDQSDRLSVVEGSKKAESIKGEEQVRLQKVLEMVRLNRLSSGRDFYRAAVLVQRSEVFEHIVLAHDLSLTALALGEKQASAVSASTEDRFLLAKGLKQRYGTQYAKSGLNVEIAPLSDGVTDTMRALAGVPPLAEAKANAAAFAASS